MSSADQQVPGVADRVVTITGAVDSVRTGTLTVSSCRVPGWPQHKLPATRTGPDAAFSQAETTSLLARRFEATPAPWLQ